MKLKLGFVVVSLGVSLFLSGCGGSSSSATSGSSTVVSHAIKAAGVYSGTSTSSSYGTIAVDGVVAQNGRAFFFAPNQGDIYAGTVNETNDTVTGPLTAYAPVGYQFPDGSSVTSLSINANTVPQSTLSGTFSGGGESGTFTLGFVSSYEESSSLSKIAGTYTYTQTTSTSTDTLSITVDSTGLVTGSDSTGCVYNGQVSLIDSSKDAYDVTATITSCGALNGTYKGVAALTKNVTVDDTLLIGIYNPTTAIAQAMTRS